MIDPDHVIKLRVENVPEYSCILRLQEHTSGPSKMTTLLFTIDLIKERVGISKMVNQETQVFFDEENMSTPEEILNTKMEEVLIRRVGEENPFTDVYEQL